MHPATIIGTFRLLIVDVAMGQIPRSTERISSYQCVRRVVTLVMTAQTMSFRYELACKGHSTEKAQDQL